MVSKRCKHCGKFNCKEHGFFVGKTLNKKSFSGSTPPEIFVGKWNYPNVYAGILSPQEYGNTGLMSSPELWHKNNLPISKIVELRNELVYGRQRGNIKAENNKFLSVMKEVAMTYKSIGINFDLKNPIVKNFEKESEGPLMPRVAFIERARLEENAPVKKKVDYLVNDSDVKSVDAIKELHKSGMMVSSIIKILSAGLLGLKKNRRLVPTRWSITAVDDTLSKNKLGKIKLYYEISEIQVFHSDYLGNYYNFILLPGEYSFEVIEISLKAFQDVKVWQDWEGFVPRKKYADSVTGAYYANRLALVEYLEKIKRQAQCLVLREIRPEYYASCGVGILREISRDAFSKKPEKFDNLQETFQTIQKRLKQPISNYLSKSWLLKNYGKQKKLLEFF